jgi:zinc transporter ZupT
MTVAISIHNVPEGTAISIPLRAMGASDRLEFVPPAAERHD